MKRSIHISEVIADVAADMFEMACIHRGLGKPEKEYRFHPTRKWRFDYAFPDEKIALEVEGGIWTRGRHTRGKGVLGDMTKYNEAAIMGWTLLRTTPDQLLSAVLLVERAMKEKAA